LLLNFVFALMAPLTIFLSQNRPEPPAARQRGWASTVTDQKEIVMTIGTVKFFNSTKGFGFIQPDDGGADVFVHISAVERAGLRTIVEGQKLSFDVVKDNRSGKSAAENLQAA
jgi:CspA family cold shock protein